MTISNMTGEFPEGDSSIRDMPPLKTRIAACFFKALPQARKTAIWLIRITVPVSLAVMVLKSIGALDVISSAIGPVFALIGLPGEAGVVFTASALLNIYSAVVIMETLGMSARAATILALMCLISHNIPVETAVQRRIGSNPFFIVVARLLSSFVAGAALNIMLPGEASVAAAPHEIVAESMPFHVELITWSLDISRLCLLIFLIITILMFVQNILEEFGVIRVSSIILKYPLALLGVPSGAAFLWVVANTLGLAYGSGIIINQVENGKLSRRDADILNYHIAISHSLLEDTIIFASIGAFPFWITVPRIIIAGIVVWLKRLICRLLTHPAPASCGRQQANT